LIGGPVAHIHLKTAFGQVSVVSFSLFLRPFKACR